MRELIGERPVENPFGYWARVVRFAVLGRPPVAVRDVPVWAVCVPFRQWNQAKRYDGETFGEAYTRRASRVVRLVVPYRALYLMFLLLWPILAWMLALPHGRHAWSWWRHALFRPDESMVHPQARHTEREWAWMRPDYALCMLYAWEYAREPAPFHALDDKFVFLDACRRAGLPVPPTFTAAEAIARGGSFIVKDPQRDLGYGVEWLSADELRDLEDADTYVIQQRLRNHPALLAALPATGALSTLRVFTALNVETGEVEVVRTAIRISRAHALADNTAQGGFWCRVEQDSGAIVAGVTKKTFGAWKDGAPVRFGIHPDTGRRFEGLIVPWFAEGQRMALDAHSRLAPAAPSLGWDIALAEDGPVFLEVNVWTVCYDYDPPTDLFTPGARWIVRRVGAPRS